MQVTIWDLDYYYAKDKTNCFNPTAMLVSSYHKQLGDRINFVMKKDDIGRPYDLCYIFSNNPSNPKPPYQFFLDAHVKWYGDGVKGRVNWKPNDVMLACRPDYLLYPEKNTTLERSEQIRLLNNSDQLLPQTQDISNTFHRKRTIVTDTRLWICDAEVCKQALERLQGVKNVSFLKPIWLPRILSDKTIRGLFMNLDLTRGAGLTWLEVNPELWQPSIQFLQELKEKFSRTGIGMLPLRIFTQEHWNDAAAARNDLERVVHTIIQAKQAGIHVGLQPLRQRLDTPYFFVFEALGEWSRCYYRLSWLEYLTLKYGPGLQFSRNVMYWAHPYEWSDTFRDLLRQTYKFTELLLIRTKDSQLSRNDLPLQVWEKEFEYGI